MKRYVWYFLLFNLIIVLVSTAVRADMDCMDNSYHLDQSCGPDFKKYHQVQCNCPCTKYAQSFNRGRCEQCWHYRAPRPLEVVRYTPPVNCVPAKANCCKQACKPQ